MTANNSALAAQGKQCTEDLLRAMGFEAVVTAKADEDHVDVAVSIPDQGELLTGPKGEVRQAIQHVLNLMLNRGGGMRYHLQLEINDFWQRREVELAEMARQMASDAIATGAEQVTGWLNAAERRVIHVTLREDLRVRTFSIGDGMIKRLGVAPADSGWGTAEGE